MKEIRIKRLGMLLLVVCLTTALAGCKSNDNKRNFIPLGTNGSEDAITQVYSEKFAEEVERLSGGDMVIKIFPNGTLGNDKDLLEACADGDIPFVAQNTAPQVSLIPEVAVLDMPMVFDTIEEARTAIDDETFSGLLSETYVNSGYRLLGMADQGFRVMTSNKEITDESAFIGQKIRTMDNSNHLMFWQTIGANPTPMAFSEVYIGLQQKTIDAQENPVDVIISGKLYEQQKYIALTNHVPHYLTMIMSDEYYQKLSSKEQEIIDEAAVNATEYTRTIADERVEDQIAKMEEEGVVVLDLTDETRTALREQSQKVYDEIGTQVGTQLVEAYLNAF